MTRSKRVRMLSYVVLILSATFLMVPASAMAKKGGNNWWDVKCEVENPSDDYDSMLYCEIAPKLHEIEMNSDRVTVEVIGQSEAGRNLFLATVTNPMDKKKKGKKDKGKHKDLRKLMIDDPEKALEYIEEYDDFNVPVMMNCSIHGGEYPGTDACMRMIEYLAYDDSEEVDAILDNVIVLFNVVQNPDGRVMGTRNNAQNINLNRDFFTQSQPETRATVSVITEWNPMVLLDLHGFVDPMLIEPCTPPHNPNYEYDLYLTWAWELALAMEAELFAQTDETETIIPYRDWDFGWDDWPGIYAAMYPIYHGAYGHTIETPHRDARGVAAHYAVVWGMLNFVVENKEDMIRDQIEVFRRGFLDLPQQLIPDYLLAETPFEQYNEMTIQDFPAAYIIPADEPYQISAHQAKELVDFMIFNDVQVEKSKKAFTYAGVDYPKDTYIVWMDQPKRGLANAILEPGDNLSDLEGLYFYSPPSVWSHPLLWGASVAVMDEPMDIGTKEVKKTKKLKGDVEKGKAAAWAFLPTSIAAFQAANELLAEGVVLYRTEAPFEGDDESLGAGAFIIPADVKNDKGGKGKKKGKKASKVAKDLAKDYGLDVIALDEMPEGATPLKERKIAVYGDGGVTECLKALGFAYDEVSMDDLNGGLMEYDVFINLYVEWDDLDAGGQTAMTEWFAAGGDYVGLGYRGYAVDFAIDAELVDVAYGYTDGNAIVNVDYDPNDSVAAGFREDGYAFVYRSVWFTDTGDMTISASLDSGEFLVSGFWEDWEISGANGMPIVVHQTTDTQDVTLIGNDPTFRGHPKNSFRIVGNAIFDGLE